MADRLVQMCSTVDLNGRRRPIRWLLVASATIVIWGCRLAMSCDASALKVASFAVDVTPALGSPVAYAPTRSIDDPISARGVVVLGAGKPIVLCAVDFLGIGNTGYARWQAVLAEAVGTDPTRVAVHTLHQHDAPRCDFAVEELLAHHGLAGQRFDVAYLRDVLQRLGAAAKSSLEKAQPVTHIGMGAGTVQHVASNRRILGADGKVSIVRWSRTTDEAAIAAPEGLIDPQLRMVSFWNQDTPITVLTYYATHPQSYYGQGDVTCEFVGLARNQQQEDLDGLPHIHFNGASGNITAGKYNDGSPQNRSVLAKRLQAGMQQAWQQSLRKPITAEDVTWTTIPVQLPASTSMDTNEYQATLDDVNASQMDKLMAAKGLVWLRRCQADDAIELSCLSLGDVRLLHLPGELFIEYQLAAQAAAPNQFVAVAAYGDYGPGYIGTAEAYEQGGYEVRRDVSRVSPEAESVLQDALRELLRAAD